MRRGDGGACRSWKKPACFRGKGGRGGCTLNIGKQRDSYTPITLRLTQTHHPPTEVSLPLSLSISLSLQDQALCHPTPIQNSSGNKELITANWMRKNMESDWMCCGASEISILQDVKLDYHSLLRHPLHLILFISSTNAASYKFFVCTKKKTFLHDFKQKSAVLIMETPTKTCSHYRPIPSLKSYYSESAWYYFDDWKIWWLRK